MELRFKYKEMEKLYREAGYHHRKMPHNIHRRYTKTCQKLESATMPSDLYATKALNFEKYNDHYSVRITKQRRIEFDMDSTGNITILTLLDANNHYKKNF